MKIKIELDTANDAFSDGNLCHEAARILHKLAERIERNGTLTPGDSMSFMDVNGNTVGFSKVTK